MPITIDQPKSQPAVVFDKVHLTKLTIALTEDNISQARVLVQYKLFGRDESGKKHMAPEQYSISIDDAFAEAVAKAQAGKPALAQALAGIEAAVAALVTEQGTHGTATASA